MSDATLSTIFNAVKDLAYTSRSVVSQQNINTYPRIIIQDISSVPSQHINGVFDLTENQATLSLYGTDPDELDSLESDVIAAVMTLSNVWYDSSDPTIIDRGDGDTLTVYRKTLTFTFFIGAS